jgi:hypothetical protein
MPTDEIQNPELRQLALQERRVKNLRRILVVSVGFNLFLAAACWFRFAHCAEAVRSSTRSAAGLPFTPPVNEKIATSNAFVAVAPAQPIWGVVETDDYKKYVANLRAVGCPERTVRHIIVADVNEYYAHQFLKEFPPTNRVEYWRPGDPLANLIDEAQVAKLQEFAKEKRGFISTLLGADYSGEVELTSIQVKVFMQRLLDFLTPQQRDAMGELEHKYTAKMLNTFKDSARGDNESARTVLAEKDEEVLTILSPDQKFEYDLRRSDASMMLRVGLGDFDLTEQEFRNIFPAMQRFIANAGMASFMVMVRGDGDPREETLAARQELLGSLHSVLSEQRFAELMEGTGWNLSAP